MGELEKVEEKLRRKEAEIHTLEEKLKAARVYVQALKDVVKLLDSDKTDDENTSAETVLRQGSAVAQARDVITNEGHPVHINDLLKAMGREPTRDNRASLTSSLAAYVRRGEIFTRPAPNTFGLVELGHDAAEESTESPPNGFGRLSPPSPSSESRSEDGSEADDDENPF